MKRVLKGDEPLSLTNFRAAQPQATWEQFKRDELNGGQLAYADIRTSTHQHSGGLCGYCEIDIRDNSSSKSRIEHFHAKSDKSTATNWALAWDNMFAVCHGGSYRHGIAPYTLEPLEENLTCDAHKDRLIQQGRLPEACEDWLMHPLQLQAWPSLLKIQ